MKSLCAPLSPVPTRAPTCVHTPSQMTTARCRLTLPGHRGAHRGEHRCARHTFTDLMAALCRLFCGEPPRPVVLCWSEHPCSSQLHRTPLFGALRLFPGVYQWTLREFPILRCYSQSN